MNISELSQKIIHDAADESFRLPIGAAGTGSELYLRLRDGSGGVAAAYCLIWRDGCEEELPMLREGGYWSLAWKAPMTPDAHWYCFRLMFSGEELWLCAGPGGRFGQLMSSRGEGFRLTVYDSAFRTPAWFRRSVMYQIFPDRFARDEGDDAQKGFLYHRSLGRNMRFHESWDEPVDWQPNSAEGFYFPLDFYGGTLRGIEERLPYLQSLGVGVIYLNPIFEACSNHRYDTADYLNIDPVLGTNEDFTHLCRTAENLGIRLMLDGVFSHTGADSVYFNRFSHYPSRGAYNAGEASDFFPWFDFRSWPEEYRCWWNFPDLPEVDEQNAAWQDFIISGDDSVIRTWLRRGAAGFRLDVADELPDEALALIRRAAKEESAENVVLGEVWEDAVMKTSYGVRRKYALGESLDSVMNYPLRSALIDFFCFRTGAPALSDFLLSQRLNYPASFYYSLMNLLSSHDVERIRTALATRLDARTLSREQQAGFLTTDSQDARGAAMQALAAVVQFTLPGVPCIYYGDELGMEGMLDPFDRAPFHEGRRPLLDWYAKLGRIRNENPALATGEAAFSAPDADVLCILRLVRDGRDIFGEPAERGVFLALINRAGGARRVVCDLFLANAGLSADALSALRGMNLTHGVCLLTGTEISVSHGLADITLPPETAHIIRLG